MAKHVSRAGRPRARMNWNRLSMVALGVGFALLPGCRRAAVQPRTAGGGELLLVAIPSAVAVVLGRVEESRRIDDNLYAAWLQVDRVLAGTVAPAARVRIAWGEPIPNRAPRLADGDHIVVAIDQLPAGSPWLSRLSVAGKGEPVFAIGAKGDGFLREPDANSMSVLSRYLSLPPAARTAAAGVNVLTEFVAQGAPGLS